MCTNIKWPSLKQYCLYSQALFTIKLRMLKKKSRFCVQIGKYGKFKFIKNYQYFGAINQKNIY